MLRLGLAAVLALAVLGAVLSVAAWRAAAAPAAPAVPVATGSGPFAVGQEIRTSWGYLDVTHVDPVAGISAHDIGHAAAGVSVRDFVKEGQQELQVTLDLTSAQRARTVGYDPAQFRLRVGTSNTTVEPSLATLLRSQLQPLAVVEGMSVSWCRPGRSTCGWSTPIRAARGRWSSTWGRSRPPP